MVTLDSLLNSNICFSGVYCVVIAEKSCCSHSIMSFSKGSKEKKITIYIFFNQLKLNLLKFNGNFYTDAFLNSFCISVRTRVKQLHID